LRQGDVQAGLYGANTAGLFDTPSIITSLHLQTGTAPGFAPTAEAARPGLEIFARTQAEFDRTARARLFQEMAQWFWLDFVGRVDVYDNPNTAAVRSAYGGYDWFSTTPTAWWNNVHRRA
jgi:hypothetical protein